MNKRKGVRKVALFCVILILVLVLGYSGLRILESTVFYPEQPQEQPQAGKTVVHNGVSYFPRQDINVILLMGIDQSGPAQDSGSYNNEGNADMISLIIFDEKNETIQVLNVNRDTITEIPVLGIGGKNAGTITAQLALSHNFGSGLEDSCENTRTTVSNLFRGLYIDYYISMRMDAVSILNDAVDGVTVNVKEDFSQVDPSLKQGTQRLLGDQAFHYVRSRKDVGNQLNLNRMERQKEYMAGFMNAFRRKLDQDSAFIATTWEQAAPYLVSDLPVGTLSGMIERYADYKLLDVISLEGENVQGEFMEFYPDPVKLEELTLELFYAPKN